MVYSISKDIAVCLFIMYCEDIMNEMYECHSIRMMRFLYSLGFDKQSKFDKDGKEYWVFEKSPKLQKALDFFFSMRKR